MSPGIWIGRHAYQGLHDIVGVTLGSRSDPNGGSEPSPGRETIYWDSHYLFFLRAELVLVVIQTISIITKLIYIY